MKMLRKNQILEGYYEELEVVFQKAKWRNWKLQAIA
jgi:hypothetical protein